MDYTHRIEKGVYYYENIDPPSLGFVVCSGEAYQRYGLRVRIIRESGQRFKGKDEKRVLVHSEPSSRLPGGGYAWVNYPFMLTPLEEAEGY